MTELIVADKFGDVYTFNLNQNEEKEVSGCSLLLGHVSMIMDITLSPDQKYILTSDRDEKIRVSHYPRAFNIQSFLLGHKDLVSSMCFLPNPGNERPYLVSAAGDNSVMAWNYMTGEFLSQLSLRDECKQIIRKLFVIEELNIIVALHEG